MQTTKTEYPFVVTLKQVDDIKRVMVSSWSYNEACRKASLQNPGYTPIYVKQVEQ